MRRVGNKDKAAQRELAARIVPRVRRLCRSLIEDQSEADDASQEALVQILQSARNFRAPGNLSAWSDTITVRTALRLSRRLKVSRSLIDQVARPERLTNLALDLRKRNITPPQLEAYLGRIGIQKRQAFVLKHALDYTVEEIAILTESPAGTVKDRLVSAKKELHRMIAKDFAAAERGTT